MLDFLVQFQASQASGNYQHAAKDYRQILNGSICLKESIRSNVSSLLAEVMDLLPSDDDCRPPLPTVGI